MRKNVMRLVPTTTLALIAVIATVIVLQSKQPAAAQSEPASAKPADHDPIGKMATIHVRRDFLAGEPLLPIPPTDDRVRGVEISVRGTLRSINEEWIVLERDRNFAYVPRKSVLVMEIAK